MEACKSWTCIFSHTTLQDVGFGHIFSNGRNFFRYVDYVNPRFWLFESFWAPGRSDRGPINLVPSMHPSVRTSVHPYIRLRRGLLENTSFNFSETCHEVRVP